MKGKILLIGLSVLASNVYAYAKTGTPRELRNPCYHRLKKVQLSPVALRTRVIAGSLFQMLTKHQTL